MITVTNVILAAEESGGGAELLLPATAELIAGIIAFGIVFFFIWRWAVPAINKSLEDRQRAIGGQLREAEKTKSEADSLLAEYRGQVADAKAKQNEMLDEARAEAEEVKAGIIAKANTEAEQIVAKARQDADAERARVLADARSDVANLSIDLAERVVGGSLDRQTQLGLVERYIQDLER